MALHRLPVDFVNRRTWTDKGQHGSKGTMAAVRLHRPTPVGWGNPNNFIAALDLSRTSPRGRRLAEGYTRALADDEITFDTPGDMGPPAPDTMPSEAPVSPGIFSELSNLFRSAGTAYRDYADATTGAATTRRLNAARAAGQTGFISGLPSGTIMGIPTSGLLLAAAGLLAFKLLKN
jgi:hypothetical protein